MSGPHQRDLASRAREVLAVALRRPISPGENPTRQGEPGWDSLKHIELVLLLREQFGVRFSEAEITSLDSLDRIVLALERHLASLDHH